MTSIRNSISIWGNDRPSYQHNDPTLNTNMAAQNNVVHDMSRVGRTDMNSSDFRALISQAQASADLDSKLGIMEALRKHKKAVFWAMILSTSLVMEGYDLVIVGFLVLERLLQTLTRIDQFLLWSATVPAPIRRRSQPWQMGHLGLVAIRFVQFGTCRTVDRPCVEHGDARSIRFSQHHDVLHGLDDCCHLHPILRSILACSCCRRSSMWYPLGRFSGTLTPY